MKRLLVVIVNWRGAPDTINCLESLLRNDAEFDVVICDNASGDGSEERVRAWCDAWTPDSWGNDRPGFLPSAQPSRRPSIGGPDKSSSGKPWITWINLPENGGFAYANNRGMIYGMEIGYDLFWLLNNDTVVLPDAVRAIKMIDRPGIRLGIAGTKVGLFSEPELAQCFAGATYDPKTASSNYIGYRTPLSESGGTAEIEGQLSMIVGASMIVSRDFLLETGLMDESYFLYFEEIDWSSRSSDKFDMIYIPECTVYHKHGASIGGNSTRESPTRIKYLYRNRILFTARFHAKNLPAVRVSIFLDALRALKSKQLSAFGKIALIAISPTPRIEACIPALCLGPV